MELQWSKQVVEYTSGTSGTWEVPTRLGRRTWVWSLDMLYYWSFAAFQTSRGDK